MPTIHEVELAEVLPKLPNIRQLERLQDLPGNRADLYICALGFEERCTANVEWFATQQPFQCDLGVYLEYETNTEDNAANLPALLNALHGFCSDVNSIPCDGPDFTDRLRLLLQTACRAQREPWVFFDISVCSAKSILLVMKILLEYEVRLTIVYAEAAEYFPTKIEFDEDPAKWLQKSGLSSGVRSIIPSAEHPGSRMDPLPDMVIVYPTFKPERTRAVLAEIDESLLTDGGDALVWIVGKPRRAEDLWRTDAVKLVNDITEGVRAYEASTFDYKDSMEVLGRICSGREEKFHITLMPLGSKLQCVGAALFWEITQSISVMFAVPMSYNASRYTRGYNSRWLLDLGPAQAICEILRSVGQLRVEYELSSTVSRSPVAPPHVVP